MGRSIRIEQYPARYRDILLDVSAGGAVEVACDSEHDARRLRGHWFSFMSAIVRQAKLVAARKDKGLAVTEDHVEILKLDSLRSRVQCVQEGRVVRWQGYNRGWAAKQLERARFIDGGPQPIPMAGSKEEDEIRASEARLRELLKGDGK